MIKTIAAGLTGLVAVVGMATASNADTYVGSRLLGTTFINLSVTTDGTLGALTASNITSWNVALTDLNPNNVFTFTPETSLIDINGDALSATASSFTFNFGSAGSDLVIFYENPFVAGFQRFYCLETGATCVNSTGGFFSGEAVFSQFTREGYNFAPGAGVITLASAEGALGPVPESATWAMLIVGFGLVGGAMRYRRRLTTVSFTAA